MYIIQRIINKKKAPAVRYVKYSFRLAGFHYRELTSNKEEAKLFASVEAARPARMVGDRIRPAS